MAVESAVHGGSRESATSNGYPSDAPDHELSNGAPVGAVSPLQPANGSMRASERPRTERSTNEQKLIARGRFLLHSYQQKKREKREILDEMCFSSVGELSAVEVLESVAHLAKSVNNHKRHFANGAAVAAAASMDSNVNWLGRSSIGDPISDDGEQSQSTDQELLDSMAARLQELRSVLKTRSGSDSAVAPLVDSLVQLVERKRTVDAATSTTTMHQALEPTERTTHKVLDPAADSGGRTSTDEAERLKEELEEAKGLISELNDKVNVYRTQLFSASSKQTYPPAAAVNGASNGVAGVAHDDVRKLQIEVQEKDELLVSLRTSLEHVVQEHAKLDQELSTARAVIERLEGEKEQMQKAASDKRTLLRRAFIVKAKQLDLLCKDVELPSTWERVTDENGIIYYRQNDRACAPELEDPRVALVLQRLPTAHAGSSSPRSAGGRMEQTPLGARASDRKYSSSSFDSTVSCEDIAVPPEDGTKHEVEDFETPLPEGWEMRVTTSGAVFFVNRNTNVTTWKDPRRMKVGVPMLTKRASAPHGTMSSAKLTIDTSERRASHGDLVQTTTPSAVAMEAANGVCTFDVVFEEKGPIGIHFQASTPDAGAMVRRLLPRMAASRARVIEPFDRLVAVNKNPVDSAPFRYVMLLLQGGLRPLTLTFERDPQRSHAAHHPLEDQPDEEVVVDGTELIGQGGRGGSDGADHSSSVGTPVPESSLYRPRRSISRAYSDTSEVSDPREEDYSMADKIISNVFSLFWSLPDQPRGQVETV